MSTTAKPRDLRGDLSRYPVDPAKIPLGMPAPTFHLVTTGHLMASECQEFGWAVMKCSRCGTRPLDLIYRHQPLGENYFIKRKSKSKTFPGTAWGSDVTPICRCCSFAKCRHRTQRPVGTSSKPEKRKKAEAGS